MVDLSRRVRKVERELGVPVTIHYLDSGTPCSLICRDTELGDVRFTRYLQSPSLWERNLKAFHEDIYHARAKEKYRLQGGQCSRCKRPLRGSGECNHIVHRSKGRDDRLSNLEIVCAAMSGGCDFHQREHGLIGRRINA